MSAPEAFDLDAAYDALEDFNARSTELWREALDANSAVTEMKGALGALVVFLLDRIDAGTDTELNVDFLRSGREQLRPLEARWRAACAARDAHYDNKPALVAALLERLDAEAASPSPHGAAQSPHGDATSALAVTAPHGDRGPARADTGRLSFDSEGCYLDRTPFPDDGPWTCPDCGRVSADCWCTEVGFHVLGDGPAWA